MDVFFDVLDTIFDVIEALFSKAVKKGKDTKDIVTIKSKIATCESLENRSYAAIGRKYYEMYKDGGYDPSFEKSMKEISNAKLAKVDLEEQIEVIKNND